MFQLSLLLKKAALNEKIGEAQKLLENKYDVESTM